MEAGPAVRLQRQRQPQAWQPYAGACLHHPQRRCQGQADRRRLLPYGHHHRRCRVWRASIHRVGHASCIYRSRPDCNAILHTHPRRLLALSLRLAGRHEDFLRLPLFEADVWRAKLGFAPALPPGTTDLAEAVAEAAQGKDAVWMAGHGLCCLGRSLGDALCLAEELEHLAALQILATA